MIYSAQKLFTGNEWLKDHSVIVEDGNITDIVPTSSLDTKNDVPTQAYIIAPSFIDIQIYGAGGKLFSAYPEKDSLNKLRNYCLAGGAAHFLPTVATNSYEVFYKCIDAIKSYWESGGAGVLGIHIEGPWINPFKRGAHIESFIHVPSLQQATELLEYGKGVIKMITLAPEICSDEVVDLIQSYGVVVSAGHSNATYEEGKNAFTKIGAATHLFNAMSSIHHRAPGLPSAIMNDEHVMCSIVADNIHVANGAVLLAYKTMKERLFLITDAVTETSIGPYQHEPEGDKYVSNGILSGSSLTMMKAVRNCVNEVGIELGDALRMASFLPAKVLGMEGELGIIKKGGKANLVLINEELRVVNA